MFEPPSSQAPSHPDEHDLPDRAAALRMLRNLEATKARLERAAKQDLDEARGQLVLELLPVLDNLDRTLRAAQGTSDGPLVTGVRMVRAQIESVLHRFGVDRLDSVDRAFDPANHEAISVVPVTDPRLHGVVLEQAEPGYQFGGKLLRPAKVSVGRLLPGR